eukprot:jgi/Bigna1/138478/aug1.45_g13186
MLGSDEQASGDKSHNARKQENHRGISAYSRKNQKLIPVKTAIMLFATTALLSSTSSPFPSDLKEKRIGTDTTYRSIDTTVAEDFEPSLQLRYYQERDQPRQCNILLRQGAWKKTKKGSYSDGKAIPIARVVQHLRGGRFSKRIKHMKRHKKAKDPAKDAQAAAKLEYYRLKRERIMRADLPTPLYRRLLPPPKNFSEEEMSPRRKKKPLDPSLELKDDNASLVRLKHLAAPGRLSASKLYSLLHDQPNSTVSEVLLCKALGGFEHRLKQQVEGGEEAVAAAKTSSSSSSFSLLPCSMFEAVCLLRSKLANDRGGGGGGGGGGERYEGAGGISAFLNMTEIETELLQQQQQQQHLKPKAPTATGGRASLSSSSSSLSSSSGTKEIVLPRNRRGYTILGQVGDRRRRICRIIIGLHDRFTDADDGSGGNDEGDEKIITRTKQYDCIATTNMKLQGSNHKDTPPPPPRGSEKEENEGDLPDFIRKMRTEAVVGMLRLARAGFTTFDVDGKEVLIMALFLLIFDALAFIPLLLLMLLLLKNTQKAERIAELFLKVCPSPLREEVVFFFKMRMAPPSSLLSERAVKRADHSSSRSSSKINRTIEKQIMQRVNRTLHRLGLTKFDVLMGQWEGEDDSKWHQNHIQHHRDILCEKGLEVELQPSELQDRSIELNLEAAQNSLATLGSPSSSSSSLSIKPNALIKSLQTHENALSALVNSKNSLFKTKPVATEMLRYRDAIRKAENPPPGLSREDVIQREIARLKGFNHVIDSLQPGDWIGRMANVDGRLVIAEKGSLLLKRKGENYQVIRRPRRSKKEWMAQEQLQKEAKERAVSFSLLDQRALLSLFDVAFTAGQQVVATNPFCHTLLETAVDRAVGEDARSILDPEDIMRNKRNDDYGDGYDDGGEAATSSVLDAQVPLNTDTAAAASNPAHAVRSRMVEGFGGWHSLQKLRACLKAIASRLALSLDGVRWLHPMATCKLSPEDIASIESSYTFEGRKPKEHVAQSTRELLGDIGEEVNLLRHATDTTTIRRANKAEKLEALKEIQERRKAKVARKLKSRKKIINKILGQGEARKKNPLKLKSKRKLKINDAGDDD